MRQSSPASQNEASPKQAFPTSHSTANYGAPISARRPSLISAEFILVTDKLKMAVASLSLLGVGCSVGYYLAPAGFFEHKFESRWFFLCMIAAINLPYPVILVMQEKFDQHFDSMFGPRQTYFFRIIAVQIILAAVFAGFSHSSESPAGVLVCGVFIGCLCAAAYSSTMQLMAAWDPQLTAWASVGKDVSGALPVVTYFMLDFSASAATAGEFRFMQLFPILVICMCAVICTGLHSIGVWDKAYDRLGYDVWTIDNGEENNGEENKAHYASESDPLLAEGDVDSSGQPTWTPKWQFAAGAGTFLSFLPLPLVTLLRNPDLTQTLTLGKLASDCLARCSAALLANTEFFGMEKPNHYMLIAQMTLRTLLCVAIFVHLLHHVVMSEHLFIWLWLLFYFDGSFVASQIDVSLVRFAPVALRKTISRRNHLAAYSGLALGLLVDVMIIFAR